MAFTWSFTPDVPVQQEHHYRLEPEVRPKRKKTTAWMAPEHVSMGRDMRRDYPRNEKGERIEGKDREIKIDPRPTIMVPPRKTRIGWL